MFILEITIFEILFEFSLIKMGGIFEYLEIYFRLSNREVSLNPKPAQKCINWVENPV